MGDEGFEITRVGPLTPQQGKRGLPVFSTLPNHEHNTMQ